MRLPFQQHSKLVSRLIVVLGLLAIVWVGCNDLSDRVTAPPTEQKAVPQSDVLSMDNARVQAIADVQERHTEALMSRPGVVGTGIGADANGNPVILILTERAGVANLPATIDGIATRVDVVGAVHAMAGGYKKTYRPVPGGVSVGNDNECAAGTIGCMVLKGSVRYALSNNHVFARVNAASIGEQIDQPGRYDSHPICNPSGQIGTLADFVPINFGGSNQIDCAIAGFSAGIASTCSMVDNLYTPSSTVVSPSVGLAVKKVGRTSGLTHGTIAGVNVTINVDYGSPGVATFTNQIYVASSFIRSGDSGSLMVTETGANPVGLNFAGGSGTSFANPIGPVLQGLGVSVCGQ